MDIAALVFEQVHAAGVPQGLAASAAATTAATHESLPSRSLPDHQRNPSLNVLSNQGYRVAPPVAGGCC